MFSGIRRLWHFIGLDLVNGSLDRIELVSQDWFSCFLRMTDGCFFLGYHYLVTATGYYVTWRFYFFNSMIFRSTDDILEARG